MFDIAWSELALIGGVALLVIGPKDLPKVMRTMGQWTRKARLLAGEFQRNLDDMMRESELAEMKKQVQSVSTLSQQSKADLERHLSDFDPNKVQDMAAAASLKQEASILPPTTPTVTAAETAPEAATGTAAHIEPKS
ncbi:MAG TPA: Sec-independent protein translocase protein TatB [Candidatus Sulfotelmatobacter sp.]|jgi:sec-independent protein translocase protein TatB|nr:Sec-independent protein translocase protein TatB [Candidatus Sulfotelmatobacter sp.]